MSLLIAMLCQSLTNLAHVISRLFLFLPLLYTTLAYSMLIAIFQRMNYFKENLMDDNIWYLLHDTNLILRNCTAVPLALQQRLHFRKRALQAEEKDLVILCRSSGCGTGSGTRFLKLGEALVYFFYLDLLRGRNLMLLVYLLIFNCRT